MKQHTTHESEWEPVIGLEIHAELNTKSKMFSSAPNHFGDEPNSNISEVDTAMPGALPVVNMDAVKKACQFGLAIGAKVATFSQFDRKSYFYPDSPRNFQITQFTHPIVIGGKIVANIGDVEKEFAVHHAHLEDDAGMLKHFSNFAGVDYNRAGVPLLEIVSEACMHSGRDAAAYGMAVKAILDYLDVCDCNMEEGSLRIDVNVSVRKKGEKGLRNKIEIKNMNSFSNLERAVSHEVKRQIAEYEKNSDKDPKDVIEQATYRFDPELNETILMRRKEYADDYRYFPEPDLLPVILTESYIEDIRKTLPELPLQREKRYQEQLGLATHQAFAITYDKKIAAYFEECLKTCKNAKNLANWIIVEFSGRLKEQGKTLPDTPITPKLVATLVNLIETQVINGKIAKSVADEMVAHPGKTPEDIIKENPDFRPIVNRDAISPIVDSVIAANQQSVQDFLSGRDRAFAFLVGQVMKQTKGSASPEVVNELLRERIKNVVQK
jgi:aspartyl-tRNA(Asn)/glutamyl-tRNA(Gln) amidotransferase subunit B